MRHPLRQFGALAAFAALMALAPAAHADSVQTKVVDFGSLPPSFTTNYGSTFLSSQIQPADTFYEDYRFSVASGSFSSVTATFDLGNIFGISNLSARLLSDPNGSLALTTTPWTLSSASVLERWSAVVAEGTGSGSLQVINPYALAAGSYVLEVRGNVVGDLGGSYAGVFNVASVPEASGAVMAAVGLGLLAVVRRRG